MNDKEISPLESDKTERKQCIKEIRAFRNALRKDHDEHFFQGCVCHCYSDIALLNRLIKKLQR